MTATFPTSVPSYTNPTGSDTVDNVDHAAQHANNNDDTTALATKLGTGSSTPAAGSLLKGTGVGTSSWLAKGTALQQLRVNAGATDLEWASITGLVASDVTVAEVVSSTTETTVATLTIPANTLGTAGLLHGICQMDHLDNVGASHTVRVKLDGVIFYECVYTPSTSANRRAIVLEFWLSGFGATNAQVGSGRMSQGLAGSSAAPGAGGAGGDTTITSNNNALTKDSTGALDITITITHGSSSSSKSTKCFTAHLFKLA